MTSRENRISEAVVEWPEPEVERLRAALSAIANSEIPGVSGSPHGPSVLVMEFAAKALGSSDD